MIFPEHKLAVEIDKNGHKNREEHKENEKENAIKKASAVIY